MIRSLFMLGFVLVFFSLFLHFACGPGPASPKSVPTNTPTITYTPTITFTPTSTSTPCNWPSNTCTFTPSPTFTNTLTPTLTPTNTPVVSVGIFWPNAEVEYVDYSTTTPYSQASLYLSVNGVPDGSATVLLRGSSISGAVTLPYGGVSQISGSNYAYYGTYTGFTYTPGSSYSLTSLTSIGSASATVLSAPGTVALAWDNSYASWSYPGLNLSYAGVFAPYCSSGSGGCGWTYEINNGATSPTTLTPGYTSAYHTYWVQVSLRTSATTVVGAQGPSGFDTAEYYLNESVPY